MSEAEPEVPEISVCTDKPYPDLIKSAGQVGLSQLVYIAPKIDQQEDLFLPAAINNSTRVQALSTIDDSFLLLEITTKGSGVKALRRMRQTLEEVKIIANLWHNPTEYKKVVYPETKNI